MSVSTRSGKHASPACSAFGDAYDDQRTSTWSADGDPERGSLHAASLSSSTVSKVSRGTNKSMKSNRSRVSTNLTMVPEVPKIPDHVRSQLSSVSGVEPLVPTSAVGQGPKDETASLTRSARGHNRSATEGQSSVVAASMTTASTADSYSTPQWEPSERHVAVRSSAPSMLPVVSDGDEGGDLKTLRGLGLKAGMESLESKPLPPPPHPAQSEAPAPTPALSADDGARVTESPHPAMSMRRTSTPDHTEYLVTPTCATADERLTARSGPVVASDSEGEQVLPGRKELGQRPMGPRKNYFNGHIRDSSDVKMAVALAQSQSTKLTRSFSSDSKAKMYVGGPREPTRPTAGGVSRSASQTLPTSPLTNASVSPSNSRTTSLDQGTELLTNNYDLTPGLEDGGRRPRKKGMPMQELRRWLEASR